MTDLPEELFAAVAQEALRELNRDCCEPAALDTLIACDVLVPLPMELAEREAQDLAHLTLPVVELPPWPRTVPVFTSEERLSVALPHVPCYRQLRLGLLAASWPADAGLSLSIDIGHPDSLTFSPDTVRSLLARPQR
ncbi:SseB family protein [Streptomyces monticola]|uniref:SseB family protein n=1 Tax=Streptomyces monticola TaxID=2666263 RepID=A0ABW2JNR5_9ACTN